jgi:hypothetical protein
MNDKRIQNATRTKITLVSQIIWWKKEQFVKPETTKSKLQKGILNSHFNWMLTTEIKYN